MIPVKYHSLGVVRNSCFVAVIDSRVRVYLRRIGERPKYSSGPSQAQ